MRFIFDLVGYQPEVNNKMGGGKICDCCMDFTSLLQSCKL